MAPAIKTRLLGSQSDERLFELAREGSQTAFETLARRYRRPLLRHCRQLCLSEESAQEVLRRTISEAWSGIEADADPLDLRPWLHGIAQRIAAEQMRSLASGSAPGPVGAAAGPSVPGGDAARDGAPTADEVLALRGALVAMTPRRGREGIVVHRANGNKVKVVADEAFEIADSAVRGLVGRARRGISALTPPPLLAWALGRAAEGGPAGERIAELGAGGGAAGLAGLAVKGGIAALTAGAAITGAVIAQSRSHSHAGGRAHHAVVARSSSGNVAALRLPPTSAGAAGAGASAGERRGVGGGSRHRLVASVTSPTRTSVSTAQTTQQTTPGAGSAEPSSGASPSNQSTADPQSAGQSGQTSTSSTQTTSSEAGASGGAASGATAPTSAPTGTESSPSGSTGQSSGQGGGIGVHISVGGESSQPASAGSASSGSSGSGSAGSTESSSSTESSKGIGIGISISLEPIGSVGVHVSLP